MAARALKTAAPLWATSDSEQVPAVLLDALARLIGWDEALILLCEGEKLVPSEKRGETAAACGRVLLEEQYSDLKRLLQEKVLEQQEAVLVPPSVLAAMDLPHGMAGGMLLPLSARGEVYGAVLLLAGDADGYDEPALATAEVLAGLAAEALHRSQAWEALRGQARELEALQALSRALRRAHSVDAMIPILLEVVTSYLQGDRSCLLLVQPQEQAAVVQGCYPYEPELIGQRLSLEAGIGKLLSARGEVYVSADWRKDGRLRLPAAVKRYLEEITTSVWLPLQFEGRLLGIFQLGYAETRAMGTAEKRILTALMDVAAVAITRLHQQEALAEELNRRTREMQQRQQVSEGLRYILTILNSNRPLEEVLEYIVSQACWLLDTTTGAVHRWHPDTGTLSVQVTHGLPVGFSVEKSIPLGKEVVMHAIQTRESVAIGEFHPTDQFPETDGTLARKLAAYYQAMLASPIIISDEVYGCLVLYFPEPHDFTDEDIYLATTFCDQAALAIENARLRTEVEKSAIAAERTRLAQDLHDAVTQNLFSSSIIAEVLPKIWERNPEEGRRRLEEVRRLNKGALAEMRSLLMELRPKGLTEVSLDLLLQHLVEALQSRTQMPIELKADPPGTLPPDVQVSLYRIAQEALNNVAKHAHASQASVHLRVRSNAERGRLELSIQDNGIGFDPSTVQGQHLGLKIMRERAEAINASLRIDTAPGNGTTVLVRWPDAVSPG
ncbi:MAG: GAF domain-containing protein [Caldilineae bacterium]|nr:MAG: GAF domain-containing protein [Caldilineae bacterium]